MWPMKAWFITDTHHWLLSMYHTTLNKVDLKYCQTTLSNFSISLYSTLATCLLVFLFWLPGKFGTWKCDLNMMLSYNQVFFWSQNVFGKWDTVEVTCRPMKLVGRKTKGKAATRRRLAMFSPMVGDRFVRAWDILGSFMMRIDNHVMRLCLVLI